MVDTEPVPPAAANAGGGPTMRERAARGSVWALLGFGGSNAIRLGSNLLLTRMVSPEAFGLMAIVRPLLSGLALFSDIGIGPSLIQSRRDDPAFLNTAWTIQAVRGLVLSVIAAAIAWPMAQLYEQPVLLWVIPVAGLSAFAAGLRSSKLFTLNRKLAVGKVTSIELSSQLAGAAVTIVWAVVDPSVWALAAGGIVAPAVKAGLSHLQIRGPANRLTWDKGAARALFGFGKWVFVSTLLGFLASQSDRLVFGKLVPIETLGVYSIAVLIATVPEQVQRRLALTIDFPLYSRVVRDDGDLAAAFRSARRRVLLLSGFILAALIGGGPAFMDVLYEDTYRDAGWMIQLLAGGLWFNALEASIEAALLARGESGRVAAANGAKVVVMFVLMPLGFWLAGFPGGIAGFAAAELARYGFARIAAHRARLGGLRQDFGFTLLVGGSAALGTAVLYGLRELQAPPFIQAAAIAIAVALCWMPLAWPLLRNLIGRLRARRSR